MTYTLIDPELMRSQMLSLDATRTKLAPTEGLTEHEFDTDGSSNVHFELPDNWNVGFDSKEDFDTTDATVSLGDTELPLTKQGILDFATTVGVSKSLVANTPGNMVAPLLDWHYANGANGKAHLKLLAGDAGALALTRGTVQPFSNTALLDAIVETLATKVSSNDLMVDYKLTHDLDTTKLRVVLPSVRNISSARSSATTADPWSLGIELSNSLTAASPLELNGYLFAWWCTNGCTTQHASSGKYRRKPSLSPEDAYSWARQAVNDVFNDLEHELDNIEALTQIQLEGEITQTLGNVFERFDVPVRLREHVIDNLAESDDLTAYGLLNSITAVANDPSMSDGAVAALLRAGGDYAHAMTGDRCPTCRKF